MQWLSTPTPPYRARDAARQAALEPASASDSKERLARYSRRVWTFVDIVTDHAADRPEAGAKGKDLKSPPMDGKRTARPILNPDVVHGYRHGPAPAEPSGTRASQGGICKVRLAS